MNNNNGFSLMELMIACAILTIITMIAIPSYLGHVENTRRIDAQRTLLDAYARMERYYTENNTYATATINTSNNTDILTDPDGGTAGQVPSSDSYYTISITAQTATTYTITAAPNTEQAGDTVCASLTINQLGLRGQTGSGNLDDCWK